MYIVEAVVLVRRKKELVLILQFNVRYSPEVFYVLCAFSSCEFSRNKEHWRNDSKQQKDEAKEI